MLVKKISFRVNSDIDKNEDGMNIQKSIESILEEYKKNNYFNFFYDGHGDKEIIENNIYVTEYQGHEFRGSIEECNLDGKKNYKVYIKDYKGELFHIGYVPFGKVAEIEEWMDNNKNLDMKGSIYITGGKSKYYDANNDKIVTEENEYEFEVELRFYNNKKEKTHKIKIEVFSKLLRKWWIWLCLILVIAAIFVINSLMKPKFEVKDFSISKDTIEYTTIEDTVYYTGEGKVICNDKEHNYIALVKANLISGGSKEDDEYISLVTITNGKGRISTYDSGKESEIKKPKYEFEILGYIKLK